MPPPPTILGVDPGGAATGLVVRCGATLVSHTTVRRDPDRAIGAYLEEVLAAVENMSVGDRFELIAVEAVVAPGGFANGRRSPISLPGLIGTAIVAGGVAALGWSCPMRMVWVPPGHNGQGALVAYPAELCPTRGQGKGADGLRHERSAWDVAGVAALTERGYADWWEETFKLGSAALAASLRHERTVL